MPRTCLNDQTAKLKMRLLECNREAARIFHQSDLVEAKPRGYLSQRGLTAKTVKRFGLETRPIQGFPSSHLRGNGLPRQELIASLTRKSKNGNSYDLFRTG
jgi:DNA primase